MLILLKLILASINLSFIINITIIKTMINNEENLAKLGSVFLIEVDKIKPNSQQPRTEFDAEKLKDLAESIRQYGVLQPLVVTRKESETPSGVTVEYELIAGERRLRASKIAGLSQVPVVIRRESDERMKLELAIIENLQREDLNPIERAKAFKKLSENFKLKHHEIAMRVGKSREYVSNSIRLLALPEQIQEGLSKGEISEGHCRTILTLDGKIEDQLRVYKEVIEKKMTVRQTERIAKGIMSNDPAGTSNNAGIELKSIEKRLSESLGTKVQIALNGGKGTIFIDFFSDEELKKFLSKVVGEKAASAFVSDKAESEQPVNDSVISSEKEVNVDIQAQPAAPLPNIEADKDDNIQELLKNFSVEA